MAKKRKSNTEDWRDGDVIAHYQDGRSAAQVFHWQNEVPAEILTDIRDTLFAAPIRYLSLSRIYRAKPLYPGDDAWDGDEFASLNLFARAGVGAFIEVCEHFEAPNDAEPPPPPAQFVPLQSESWDQMSRFWMNEDAARVPVPCIVTAADAVEVVVHFWRTQGGKWPDIPWRREGDLDWEFFIPPEDEDCLFENEPLFRPASQESRSIEELDRERGYEPED